MFVELSKNDIKGLLELLENLALLENQPSPDVFINISRKLKGAKSKHWWEIQFRKKDIQDRVEALRGKNERIYREV